MILTCAKHGTTYEFVMGRGGCTSCDADRSNAAIDELIEKLNAAIERNDAIAAQHLSLRLGDAKEAARVDGGTHGL